MCELNKRWPSRAAEICMVVYYTEMADQYPSCVSQCITPSFLRLIFVSLFLITKMEASKGASCLFCSLFDLQYQQNGLAHCRHSINIWWIKKVWAEFLSLQTQTLTNTSHTSNEIFFSSDFTTDIYVTKITSIEFSLVAFSYIRRIFTVKPWTYQGANTKVQTSP